VFNSPNKINDNGFRKLSTVLKNHKQTNKQNQNKSKGVNADFYLKILTINGKKVRVQLWDQGSNMNPQTTFQPLFIRHVSGCIIVAKTSNPKSLQRAHRWKEIFDKKTKVNGEPSIPACLFINHDILTQSDIDEDQEDNTGKFELDSDE